MGEIMANNDFVIENGLLKSYKGKGGDVVIPDGVTKICYYALAGYTGLTSVTIPDSVSSIGLGAFEDCENLTSVTISDGVTKICDGAFRRCTHLKSMTIGNNVTWIGDSPFYNCMDLKTAPAKYKAFDLDAEGNMSCRDLRYTLGEWNECAGDLRLCANGLHYCENLFEVFDYYCGLLDEDIAICLCEVEGKILTSNTSKCCARRLKPVRRLTREEIINILNGGEPPKID